MEKVLLVIEIIGAVCALIPTLISVFCLIKNIIKNKNWELVKKITMEAMTSVEEYAKDHPEMTSDEKLEMALGAVKAGLTAAGISFDEALIEQIIAYINELCSWSKTVNNSCKN